MKSIKYTLFILSLILFFSCKKYDKDGNIIKSFDELEKANWLLGSWEYKDTTGTLHETWTTDTDSSYVGKSYFVINEKDTLHNESFELIENEEHLIYNSAVIGEDYDEPVPFQLTKDEDSVLIFENPKHDYPNKIEYKLNKNSSLQITISGKVKGKNNKTNYLLYKIK